MTARSADSISISHSWSSQEGRGLSIGPVNALTTLLLRRPRHAAHALSVAEWTQPVKHDRSVVWPIYDLMKAHQEMSAQEIEGYYALIGLRYAPTLAVSEIAKAASVSADERRKLAKSGQAMPDGSFPIPDESHLSSAIRLARTPEHRAHIKKRARALGKSHLVPQHWT